MQIKQRLKINAIASAITVFIIIIVSSLTLYKIYQAVEESNIANRLMATTLERVALRIDYQRTGDKRAKEQWVAKHEQLGQLLKEASHIFRDAEDKKTINEMINTQESVGRIFAAIVSNREEKLSGPHHADLSQEVENLLLSQLNMRVYTNTLQVGKLQKSSTEVLFSALRLGGGGIVSVLAILIAAAVINSWTMSRAITNRVRMLRDGALVIGGGDLDHKIDVKGDDEFAELSDAFNDMTVKLRGSYHDLEREINERRRADEQLQKAYGELEERVQERTKELKELNDTLEQRISERTVELRAANETLRDSRVAALNLMRDALDARKETEVTNEELEFSNKELESFIYSVSHDLRGPLRHISGFADLLMKDMAGKLDEKGKRYLSRVCAGSERMSRLIDDLLNLSRISRQEIERNEVNVSTMAASVIAVLREAHPGRSVEVDIKEGLTASADPGLIEVVLSNLLGNAWKFTAKTEHAFIELGATEQRDKIIYYVRDNGAGFDQQYAGKMFWPFHRLHSESEFEGTGIGLAIVDRIVRRHGGKIWAEGAEGKGATVYFSLA
jgi:signal transduction histidine kinase